MRLVLLHVAKFSGKDGRKWANSSFLTEKGEVIQKFMSLEDYDKTGLSDFELPLDQVKAIHADYKSCDVQFDVNGKIEKVTV